MSDPTLEPGQQPEQADSNRRRRWTKCGCIAAACLLLLLIGGVVAIRLFVKSQYTPEEWNLMKQAEEEVLQLPPEWHQPATLPPPEVVNFAREVFPRVVEISKSHDVLLFGEHWQEQELLWRMRAGDVLTAEEQTSLSLFMTEMAPILEQSSATVQVPGYTFELDLYASPGSTLLEIQILAKLASIVSLEHLRQDKPLLAVETAALPLRMVKRPPQSYGITHRVSIAVASISAHTLYAIADKTTDTRALARGIELLKELKPVAFPGKVENWRYSDILTPLRFAAAYGYPVSLEPQPLMDFYTQLIPIHSGHYYTWITEYYPHEDPRAIGAQSRLEYLRRPPIDYEKLFRIPEEGEDPVPGFDEIEEQEPVELDMTETTTVPKLQLAASKLLVGVHPYTMLLVTGAEKFKEFEARTRIALALYDLAQIHLARRMAEIQGELPSDMESWLQNIPGIDSQPKDPFTSATYLFNAGIDAPYSVGPDRKNDNAATIYDATNGTFSAGDVWIHRN